MASELFTKVASKVGVPALKLAGTSDNTLTFFGGVPKVVDILDWPRKDGRPLTFIGQLELSELELVDAAPWLPDSGRLLFFYDFDEWPWGFDPKNKGGWRVIYESGHGIPFELLPPEDLKAENRAPKIKNLRGDRCTSIPSLGRVSLEDVGIDEDEQDDYYDVATEPFGDLPHHQVGGFPDPIQGDEMEEECQLVSGGVYCGNPEGYQSDAAKRLRAKPNDWKLLLQFDSDDDLEIMWGDSGMLYFWIRESDAKNLNFNDVWVVLQCC